MFIDPYLGNVTIFAGTFAPRSWMLCQGQLLSIADNTALFALIGTYYGGDGQVTFALPDFRGRKAIHFGQGPGLSNYSHAQAAGAESVTLTVSNLAQHNHAFTALTGTPRASTDATGTSTPGATVVPASGQMVYGVNEGYKTGTYSGNTTTAPSGSNQPVQTIVPYLAMNYIIAVEGIFPSRN